MKKFPKLSELLKNDKKPKPATKAKSWQNQLDGWARRLGSTSKSS